VDLVAHLPDGALHELGDEVSKGGYSFRIASRVYSRAAARSIGSSAIGGTPSGYEWKDSHPAHRKSERCRMGEPK
jgi:hypothetical protein